MSYLDLPRITFSGKFFADPSTINNDPGNFDPSVVLQDTDPNAPGFESWNPGGSAFFRFLDCRVTGAVGPDGNPLGSGSTDPVLGSAVETPQKPQTRVAKIVDLDPDQQSITQLVGVVVTLTLAGGKGSVTGSMAVAELRDLWFQRALGSGGDGAASGIWQSVLTDLKWVGQDASPLLKRLYDVSPDRLSIKFLTDAFDDSQGSTFCQGRLAGVIGPSGAYEPAQFVMGRRLLPQTNATWPAPWQVSADGKRLTVDLGNSLQLAAPGGAPVNQSPLQAVILAPQGPVILPTALTADPTSYSQNAWVFDVPLTTAQAGLLGTNPLSIQTADTPPTVLLGEPSDGLYANLEPFSLRLNPGESGQATLYATRFGAPLTGQALSVGLDQGPDGTNDPPGALQFDSQVTLDASGKGILQVSASQPTPLPASRKFIGSQVYYLGGDWENWGQIGQASTSISALSVLVFDKGASVTSPTWEDVGPVLSQYARLYPGMKARLDLSDYDAVKNGRAQILDVIRLPFTDPAAMPVTRDLSAYYRQMIVTWINNGCPK